MSNPIESLLQELFSKVVANPAISDLVNNSYRFIITDSPTQAFVLDFTKEIFLEDSKTLVDCEVTLTAEALQGIMHGVLNPQSCFANKQIVVKGNQEAALKLTRIW